MQELEMTWKRSTAVWWLIFWRGSLGAVLIGGIAGFIIGLFGALLGVPIQSISLINGIIGAVIGFVWFMFVVRQALRKKYGDFRVALVPFG